ncbi:hypothetical protein SAMN04489801_4665 [Pseudomonas mandelii]|uniref:Uncharacterized protein n=1 Tax=Pseudomonas mandelii TaxID=75612 RepID=A0ABY0VVE0_9PSED|nr:hypothetical protein SAMN04489801_4665 [Pseudomonas mandelii]
MTKFSNLRNKLTPTEHLAFSLREPFTFFNIRARTLNLGDSALRMSFAI